MKNPMYVLPDSPVQRAANRLAHAEDDAKIARHRLEQEQAQARHVPVCCGEERGHRRVVLAPGSVPMFRHPLARWG